MLTKPKALIVSGLIVTLVSLPLAPQAFCGQPHRPNPEKIFAQQCAQCHAGGGNLVKPKKPLAGSPKLSSLALFSQYLKKPAGHMPYYKDLDVNPAAMRALYEYCKKLKTPIKQA